MNFRFRLFSYHLLISIIISSLSILVVFGFWYKAPFAKAFGVSHIFILLVMIDVIIGPLMTLFIANNQKPKKELKQDIIIIGLIQISALLYGLYTIAIGRPAFLVFDTNRFQLVAVNELSPEHNSSDFPVSLLNAQLVAIKPSANDEERSKRLFDELNLGLAPATLRTLYMKYDETMAKKAFNQKMTFNELKKFNSEEALQILQKYPEAVGYLPMLAPEQEMTVLIDKDGNIIKIVDLKPLK